MKTLQQIKDLPIKDLGDKDSVLFIWGINKYLPELYEVAKTWGYKPSCLLTWCKPKHGIGIGGTFIQISEHLLFARRGTITAKKRIDTTWFEHKRLRHSEKPDMFRQMIEDCFDGNKIELFAREKVRDWDVWGNEVTSDIDL